VSDDNLLHFPSTRLLNGEPRPAGVTPGRVLGDALSQHENFRACLIVGLLADGSLYIADTQDHFADTLLVMERAKQALMSHFSDDELVSDSPPGTA
jgi:hypothetical protein